MFCQKGHTRHWSLDMVVRESPVPEEPATLMYLYIQMQLCQRDSLYHWLLLNNTWESRGNEVLTFSFSAEYKIGLDCSVKPVEQYTVMMKSIYRLTVIGNSAIVSRTKTLTADARD